MSKKVYIPSLIIYLVIMIAMYAERGFVSPGSKALLQWFLYSSLVAVPIFIGLYFGKDPKTKKKIYLSINIVIAIGVAYLDFSTNCSGPCIKGILTFSAAIYCAITYVIFSMYLAKTKNK